MIDNIKLAIVWLVIVVVIIGLIIGGYALQRTFHWNFGYEDRVEQAIEERVAPLEARIEELENAQENQ